MELSSKTKDILEWIACILIALVLALVIRYYVGTPTIVQQVSMYPTLKQNQRLILNRWVRTTKTMPNRGDIITFEAPSSDSYILPTQSDSNNVTAKYSNEPTSFFGKLVRYGLEIGKDSYIKRVIALPGEHVEIKDGKVYINGDELQEDYLQSGIVTDILGTCGFDDFVVPENCVFAMGDNRNHSTDCRSFGCIPLEKIESKVWIRIWPLNLFGKVK